MMQQTRNSASPTRHAPVHTTAERRALALRPTIYCPPSTVEECVRELRDEDVE